MDDRHLTIRSFLRASQARTTSTVQVVRACLDRIAAHDRDGAGLAAMLRVLPDAMEQAGERDRSHESGTAYGPLHGVPFVLKDNIDLHGSPTTSGCWALADAMPKRTASAISALADAGAVFIGKTNLSEFSFEIRSRSSLGGDTRNPFAPAVTSGGSSGGTAVAVAAGFAMAGIGTDTGGSIRVPAAYNGLVGLRPTWGVIPVDGVAPLAPSTDTVGAITRCVDDAERVFDVLAPGRMRAAAPVAGMRVGVVRQLFGQVSAIARGTEAGIAALRSAGVEVDDAPALPEAVIPAGEHIVDEEFGPAFDRYLLDNFLPGTAPASLAELIGTGRYLPEYEASLRRRAVPRDPRVRAAILERHARLREALEAMMTQNGFDALLYPPSAILPLSMDNPKGGWAPELAACSGWPALVVPVGQAADGMPLSAELLARADAEPLLFALGRTIEAGVPERPIPPLD